MSRPAARLSSLTAHGGTVTAGTPQVLISNLPAARLGDPHTCPLFNVLVPHVGGVISFGSPVVLSGGQPQARMTDPCVCGAPNIVALGDLTVLVGDTPSFDSALSGAVSATFLTQQSSCGGDIEPTPGHDVE